MEAVDGFLGKLTELATLGGELETLQDQTSESEVALLGARMEQLTQIEAILK